MGPREVPEGGIGWRKGHVEVMWLSSGPGVAGDLLVAGRQRVDWSCALAQAFEDTLTGRRRRTRLSSCHYLIRSIAPFHVKPLSSSIMSL